MNADGSDVQPVETFIGLPTVSLDMPVCSAFKQTVGSILTNDSNGETTSSDRLVVQNEQNSEQLTNDRLKKTVISNQKSIFDQENIDSTENSAKQQKLNRQNHISQSADNISYQTPFFLPLAVLTRSFSVLGKKFSLTYIPMAPELLHSPDETPALYLKRMQTIALSLKKYIPADTLCVRFDPPVDFLSVEERDSFIKTIPQLSEQYISLSPTAVQPPDTVLLNLDLSENDLLAAMKSKWRYNIHLAEKKEVIVTAYHFGELGFEEAFDQFYSLFQTTGKRDGISPHAKTYYQDLLKRGAPSSDADNPVVTLYMARNEGDWLAGIITLFCKREAVYLFGASGNLKRNLMPAYLLQWTAIKDAKQFGCPVYDFYGMPPTDDPAHPMHGLYLFKTGFGGTIVHRMGSVDVPLNKMYRMYIAAEKARAWYHRKFLKKIRGR